MIPEPRIEAKEEQLYAAIRLKVAMNQIPQEAPPLIPKLAAWLEKKSIEPTGPAFFRYCSVENDSIIEMEIGFPVGERIRVDEEVQMGSFPKGTYAVVTYMGDYSGLYHVHAGLEKWGEENDIKWKEEKDGAKTVFGARIESYPTDPDEEPDTNKWQTDVLFLIAD